MASSRQSSGDEEEEVFEITDFTTASDWERFVAQVTEAITDWQLTCLEHVRPLHKNELTLGAWEQMSKEIKFSNAVFMLTLYRLKQKDADEVYLEETGNTMEDELRLPVYMDDMMSNNNDFPPRAHCLARWYGFRSFLVLSLITSGTKTATGLTSESKCNLLLGSACIILSDSGCEVPIFIQIQQNWRKMFTGRCMGTGMQTEFDMIHLKKCPPQYQHLSGLLHIFKTKIGPSVTPVQVSARFTHILSSWGMAGAWPTQQVDPEGAASNFDTFLFGSLDDPIGDLQLSAIWPSITESMIIENDVHSDFNPSTAPVWTVRLHYADNPECLLSSYLREILKVRSCRDTVGSLVSTTLKSQETEQDIGQALNKLTDSSHKVKQIVPLVPELTSGISKIVMNQRSVWGNRVRAAGFTTVGPVSDAQMEEIMEFLLSDQQTKYESGEKINEDDYNKAAFVHEIEHQLKSAPRDSLTYRLALTVTVANFCHGGVSAIAQVWQEFMHEMRYRFENCIEITGIKSENPDLRCCLLHQKLQMLNCCIHHKIVREKTHGHGNGDVVSLETSNSEAMNLRENESFYSIKTDELTDPNPEGGSYQDEDKEVQPEEVLTPETPSLSNHLDDIPASSTEGRVETIPGPFSHPPGSPGWQDEMSSIDDDEFFECNDGEEDPGTELREASQARIDEVQSSENVQSTILEEGVQEEDVLRNSPTKPPDGVEGSEELQDVAAKEDTEDDKDLGASSNVIPGNDSNEGIAAPVGRLRRFGTARLLNSDELLYIPITQEPAPLTEDALEEQTKIFSSLGDSAEGALLRRKMQSASLHSDMESFKAANPGCTLADFVRWYSPRDYEERGMPSSSDDGALSERMRIPGNLWQTMWETAKAIPARRQKRLFDDTKEGEKVLHWLLSLQPKDLVLHLLPACFHEVISILQNKSAHSVPSVPTLTNQIFNQCCKLFQSRYFDKFTQMDDILQKITFAETLIERTMSLKHKFAGLKDVDGFVRRLMEHPEVTLEGAANGEVGKIVKQYFADQSEANRAAQAYSDQASPKRETLPPPCGREYILRSVSPRPAVQSRALPHRLYAVLIRNEFRLAGAFSSDTVFF